MEALLLTLNGVVMIMVVYMGLRDDRRPPGDPMTSLFRMRETGIHLVDEAAEKRRRHIAKSRI